MSDQQNSIEQQEKKSPYPKKAHVMRLRMRSIVLILILIVLGGISLVTIDYFTTVRLAHISTLKNLDARDGKITIQYTRPAQQVYYKAGDDGLYTSSTLSKDCLTEIHTIIPPTHYNKGYTLIGKPKKSHYKLFGIFLPPESLSITTGMEKVAVKELIPPENSTPTPGSLHNQLALKFRGDIIGRYKRGVNIPIQEMDYVRLSPSVSGYYRWVNKSLLTFNFTEDSPQFETTYTFEVFPEKFINPNHQVWDQDRTTFQVTTSINDVYVTDFNLRGDVNWQAPLRIEFSGHMVGALDVLKKKEQDIIPISITPEAGGAWTWINARTLEFQPDDKLGWPVRQKVIITIYPEINQDPDRKWRGGEEPIAHSFYVLPRKQSITSYNLHGSIVALEEDLMVSFSRAMVDELALHKPIPHERGADALPLIFNPEIKGQFTWVRPDKLKFHPENLWSELTEYTVQLNPHFNPDPRYEWTGTQKFSFKTVENLVNAEIFFTPEDRLSPSAFFSDKGRYRDTENIPPELRLWILFDKDVGRFIMEECDLSTAISFKPPVKGTFTWLSNSLLEFVPEDNWSERKNYSIMLTDKLLYHPEQHFPKGKDSFGFSVGENLVRSSLLTKSSVNKTTPIIHPPDQALILDFSKNMNPLVKVGKTYTAAELIEKSLPLLIEPTLDITVHWKSPRQLTVKPVEYWEPETLYEIRFNREILPQTEAKFEHGDRFYMKTGKHYVNIAHFSPQGRVGNRVVIDVKFTENIKPPELAVGAEDNASLFTIKPPLEGRWIWLADNKIQFKPTVPLTSSTAYTVTFNPNNIPDKRFTWPIAPERGKKQYSLVEYTFFTQALQVIHAKARFEFNEKNILTQRFFLDMELSSAVNEYDLRKHFSIWYEKYNNDTKELLEVPLLYKLKTSEGEAEQGVRTFSVVSDWIERPAKDRKIFYRITAGLNPLEGNLNLESDYTSHFLQEKPKHITLRSVKWQWQDRKYKSILSLSAPVEPEKLKEFLEIYHFDYETDVEDNIKIAQEYELNVSSSNSQRDFNYEIRSEFHAGQQYSFHIKEGMLATDGAFTNEPLEMNSQAPDLSEKLEFALNGSFLSAKDLNEVPVLSINRDSFYLTIEKIFPNNVNYFINNSLDASDISLTAKTIHHKEYNVNDIVCEDSIENKQIVTHIDLSVFLKENIHGLFRISLSDYGQVRKRTAGNSRWFLATDIGLVARRFNNNMIVWTNSLHSLSALAGCDVRVIDRWNQVIGKAYSDEEGFARITLDEGSTPTHLVAFKGDDFSFLDMRKHHDKLTGYDIEGISSTKAAIRTFIYSDRGVYRPGEKVHLVAVTRGKEGILPISYPVTFRLTNPTGKHIVSEKYTLDKHGLYIYDFDVPAEAKTGKWQAAVIWKEEIIGNYGFQVEEFIPNKIKVSLELLHTRIYDGDTLKFKVIAKNLFGPPASLRRVSGNINLRAHYFKPKGYESFKFGNEDTQFQRIDQELAETRLDEDGTHIYEYEIPKGITSPIGLAAHYSATVIDDGGRGVSSYAMTDILLYSQFVGIRRLTQGGISMDTPVGFMVANLQANGDLIPRSQQKLVVKVYRNKPITHYRKNERGYYRYITEKERVLLEELEDPRDEESKFFYTPRYSGEHIVEVKDLIGKQITHYTFHVRDKEDRSQFVEATDKVHLSVIQKDISVNGKADIEISAPFPGKILIIGERDKILFTKVLDLPQQKGAFSVPVSAEYLPNFYISAFLIKPVQEGNRHDPIYAVGLINVEVKDRSHTPQIKLLVPDRANPNSEMTVTMKVSDTNNDDLYYTIAAVDVGILELTKFSVPNMKGYFNHKRRLEVDHYSMYPMVMPYEPEVKYSITPSGGQPSRALIKKKRVSPDSQQRVKSVSLWSGLLKADTEGEGSATFTLPDFDGTLRIMAVAFGNQRFTSTSQEVLVRDKLVLKPTLPRFIATGDDFIIPVNLFNGSGKDDTIRIQIKTSDHVKLRGPTSFTPFIPQGGENAVDFAAQVQYDLGVATFEILAEGTNERSRKIIKVPVRSPGTLITKSGNGVVDKHTPKSIQMPGGFIEGTQELAMRISLSRLSKFQNSLSYLLQYPHGCLEQTTSRLFPLLYFSDLAMAAGKVFTSSKTPRYYLKEGIAKIERMQLENGAFSYWEGRNYINNWSFIYASHFMAEAQKAGFEVNNEVWKNMLSHLHQIASMSLESSRLYDRHKGVSHYIYALYVLALANENILSKLNYIYDNYFDQLKACDKARLGAAFSVSGVSATALKILGGIANFSEYEQPYRDTGGYFASHVRDLAIILDALVTVDPGSDQIIPLIEKLADKTRYGRWGSTQENAFAFLAIGKAVANSTAIKTDAKIFIGEDTIDLTNKDILLKTPDLLKGEVRIEVSGKGEVNYVWEAVGIEKNPKSLQEDNGLRIRRRFLDREGEEIDLSMVKQGDLVVAEIKIKSLSSTLSNIVVSDLLPTGLEIENARLSTSASLSWIKQDITPEYLDIRDDRINIFFTVPPDEKTYYYTTRAVTAGNFKVPAICAEAMYDPDIFSKADTGQLKIGLIDKKFDYSPDHQ